MKSEEEQVTQVDTRTSVVAAFFLGQSNTYQIGSGLGASFWPQRHRTHQTLICRKFQRICSYFRTSSLARFYRLRRTDRPTQVANLINRTSFATLWAALYGGYVTSFPTRQRMIWLFFFFVLCQQLLRLLRELRDGRIPFHGFFFFSANVCFPPMMEVDEVITASWQLLSAHSVFIIDKEACMSQQKCPHYCKFFLFI